MKYEDLLKTLKELSEASYFRMDRNAWAALADVVELHSPDEITKYEYAENCLNCGIEWYPCPTIEMIIKELT